jgi:hypothetical protein
VDATDIIDERRVVAAAARFPNRTPPLGTSSHVSEIGWGTHLPAHDPGLRRSAVPSLLPAAGGKGKGGCAPANDARGRH